MALFPDQQIIGIASPGGAGGVGTTTYLDKLGNRTQNPNPYGFIGSEGPSTQATVPYYNTKTGEQWTAPTGGYTPPSADWVQGTRPIDFAPPRAPEGGIIKEDFNPRVLDDIRNANLSNPNMMPISGPGSPFEEYLDPSMAFRMKFGTQATERLANIGGGAISGNTMRALTDYGQNLASTEYGNAFNRFQTERGNIYNTLANIAGMGQGAVNTGVNAGQNFAAGQTGLITGQAAANAAGAVGSANALAGGFGGATNAYLLNQLMRPQTPAVTPPGGYGNYSSMNQDFGNFGGARLPTTGPG